MRKIVLFGIRSPLLPDYEETCSRVGLQIEAAVRTDTLRPRILDRGVMIELADLDKNQKGLPFIACAFSPKRRSELTVMANDTGLIAAEPLLDPTAVVASSTRIGNGSYINAGVVIGAAGVLGEHIFVNRSTNLGHHVRDRSRLARCLFLLSRVLGCRRLRLFPASCPTRRPPLQEDRPERPRRDSNGPRLRLRHDGHDHDAHTRDSFFLP